MQEAVFLSAEMHQLAKQLTEQAHNLRLRRAQPHPTQPLRSPSPARPASLSLPKTHTSFALHHPRADTTSTQPRKRPHVSDSRTEGLLRTATAKAEAEARKDKPDWKEEGKMHAKSIPLKDKHFEVWLNGVLTEAVEESFDRNVPLAALKRFEIDRNSLLSKGLSAANITRIFRCLYVYSTGFHSLLADLGSQPSIYRTLWKVFAILLEYHSAGQVQTLLGEAQREKQKQLQAFSAELQQKNQLIGKGVEMNLKKNEMVFKQLKILKEQNVELTNDKIVLLEDFKQAEVAFSEEVSLRLMFENKISEVHALYRELGLKHKHLYDDLQTKSHELVLHRDKSASLTAENQQIRKENSLLKQEIILLKQEVDQHKRSAELIEAELIKKKQEHMEKKIQAVRERANLGELTWNVSQLHSQLSNAELMIQLHRQAEQARRHEQEIVLGENQQLVGQLQQQTHMISQFAQEKREVRSEGREVHGELAVLKERIAHKEEQYSKIQAICAQLNEDILEQKLIAEQLQMTDTLREEELQCLRARVEDMRATNSKITIDFEQLNQHAFQLEKAVAESEKIARAANQQIKTLKTQVEELTASKTSLESQLALALEKLASEEASCREKVQRAREETRISQLDSKIQRQALLKKEEEFLNMRKSVEDLRGRLKNQQFQRNDLDLRYRHSLVVIESDNKVINQLHLRFSQAQEQIDTANRNYRHSQAAYAKLEKTLSKDIATLEHLAEQQRLLLVGKADYIHPMLMEDHLSSMARIDQLHSHLQSRLTEERSHFRTSHQQIEVRLRKAEKELVEVRVSLGQQIERKTMQVQYERTKTKNLCERVEELELNLEGMRSIHPASHPSLPTAREKEKRYLEVIREKAQRVEHLLKEVEIMHDQNQQLIVQLAESERQVQLQRERAEKAEREREKEVAQRLALAEVKADIEKEKEKMVKELVEAQLKMSELQKEKGRKTPIRQASPLPSHKRKASRVYTQTDSPQPGRYPCQAEQQQTAKKSGQSMFEKPSWRKDLTSKIVNAHLYYQT